LFWIVITTYVLLLGPGEQSSRPESKISLDSIHDGNRVRAVRLTNEAEMANSSKPEFFNTMSLAKSLIEIHMAASIKKTTLMITTDAPRGFEVDIVGRLKAVFHKLTRIGSTRFLVLWIV
jgi:hypothetical protein